MRSIVRKYPFTSYYVLAFVIASLVIVWQTMYAAAYVATHHAPLDFVNDLISGTAIFHHGTPYANLISIAWVAINRNPIYFGVFVFGGAPTISALIITAIGWGSDGLKRLLLRLKLWPTRAFRRDALIAYAVIAGFFFAYSLLNVAIIWKYQGWPVVLGHTGVWGFPWYLFPLTFLIGGFVDEGGSQEELGWRGFALPKLLEGSASPLVVALGLGFLWWFWHFPREVPDLIAGHQAWPAGPLNWGQFVYGQGMFLLLVLCMSVVMTYFFHRTGGSVIPAILLHGWGNFLSKDLGTYTVLKFDERIYVWLAVAVLLVFISGPSLGRKRYLELRGPVDPNEPVS